MFILESVNNESSPLAHQSLGVFSTEEKASQALKVFEVFLGGGHYCRINYLKVDEVDEEAIDAYISSVKRYNQKVG